MKVRALIILALMMVCLHGEAQNKSKATRPQVTGNDDWETPITKKNKSKTAKANTATISKIPKRRTKN